MYKLHKSSFFEHFNFVLGDIACVWLLLLVPLIMDRIGDDRVSFYLVFAFTMTVIDVSLMILSDSYNGIFQRGYLKEFRAVLIHVSILFSATLVVTFFEKQSATYSRLAIFVMWIVSIVLTYLVRITLKHLFVKSVQYRKDVRSVLLIASCKNTEAVLKNIAENNYGDFRISGVVLADAYGFEEITEICGIPVVAEKSTMLDYIRKNVVDELFINIPAGVEFSEEIVDVCYKMGVVVHYNLEKLRKGYAHDAIEDFGGYTVITKGIRLVASRQLFIKRTMDIAGSLVGLLITGIAFLFVAPIIFFKSRGPIFYSQERIGINGRHFRIYKFRSMYMDADARKKELMEQNKMSGLMFKMDDDPRIIKGIGHFIRKTSIDELPQMWNVLKGEMSLVGTRPPTVDEYEQYEYHHKSRLATKPGITGLWQVSGRSDITDFEEVVELDTRYIYEWSLGLDIKILLKTVLVVFGRKGSV